MNPYLYIACMAGVTFLIRVLPLTLIRKEIKNKTVRSFLYYVPYVTLAIMTFPAILHATQYPLAGAISLVVSLVVAWIRPNLFLVAVSACVSVYLSELLLGLML